MLIIENHIPKQIVVERIWVIKTKRMISIKRRMVTII